LAHDIRKTTGGDQKPFWFEMFKENTYFGEKFTVFLLTSSKAMTS